MRSLLLSLVSAIALSACTTTADSTDPGDRGDIGKADQLACEELSLDDCGERPDCGQILVPACDVCEGGTLSCVTVAPLPCDERGLSGCDNGDGRCEVLTSGCEQPSCETMPDGQIVCLPCDPIALCVDTVPPACDELSADECAQREDCEQVLVPACDICEGGTLACVAAEPTQPY